MKLKQIASKLSEFGVEDAEFEASVLVEHFEGCSRAVQLATDKDYTSATLARAVERRCAREPLQYIIGEWDFMGYTFKVTPDTLIPRADTELLCELLVHKLKPGARFADLCTGSGCIAVAALRMREDVSGVAVELYPETIKVARQNAELHGVSDRLQLVTADVCCDSLEGEFDVIVSNPPYVTAEEMNEISPEVKREPRHALTDGGDGLYIIRKIIEIYPAHLKKGGLLAIEFGWKQGEAVLGLARELGYDAEIVRDIEGRDRILVIYNKM